MSDLCLMSAGSGVSNCFDSCGMPAIAEELQETSSTQACIILGAREVGGVLEQPTFYKEEDQEGKLSLKDPPPLIEASAHTTNGMTSGEDKKLQYALRSNPKKSRRFFEPDHLPSSAATPASFFNFVSSTMTASPIDMTTATAGAPLPSSAALPPSHPAAPVKKLNSIFSEKVHACTECGKQFPSWKALFGHMRCHPERQWRGIQPPSSIPTKQKPTKQSKALSLTAKAPPPIKESRSETSRQAPQLKSDNGESDTESIEAAFMNERDQGRPKAPWGSKSYMQARYCQRSPSPTESEVMDEHDMADCLVMLAFAAKAEASTEPSDCSSGQDEAELAIDSRLHAINAVSKKAKKSYSCKQKRVHLIQFKGEKASKYYEDGTCDRKSKFECSTCKKQFRSHQALGGHRASHKKVKGCFARTNAAEDDNLPHAEETKAITEEEERMLMMMDMQQEEPIDTAQEKRVEHNHTPEHCKMSMGQFLQCSMACHGKTAEDKNDSAMTLESRQIKHQTSSCSSSSSWSVIAATAAAGTLLMPPHHSHDHQDHHHHEPQLLSKLHQCTVCSKVFSTGQALGGHKRSHWGASPAPHSSHIGTAPGQDGDCDCGEDALLCLNNCISERSCELSRQGQQDSSSSASAEQILVTDMAVKQELGLNSTSLRDAKDGQGSSCNCSAEGGYAMDLDATKMLLKTGVGGEGGSYGLHQAEYLHLELCSKFHANSNTGSRHEFPWTYQYSEESSNFIGCNTRSPRVPFSERDASASLEAKLKNARPAKGGLLDLNLPAPVEATEEEEEGGQAPQVLRSWPDVTLCSQKKALLPFATSHLAPASSPPRFLSSVHS